MQRQSLNNKISSNHGENFALQNSLERASKTRHKRKSKCPLGLRKNIGGAGADSFCAHKRIPKAEPLAPFFCHFLGRTKKWHQKAIRSARTAGVQYERLATKIVKITRGTRVLACGENSHALHLVSELPDLRAANANLIPLRLRLAEQGAKRLCSDQKKRPTRLSRSFLLAGVLGFRTRFAQKYS
jgi:hypothetical protein